MNKKEYQDFTQFKKDLLKKKGIKKTYDALEPEFVLVRTLIKKRIAAGLSQATLAKKVGTGQSAISRLESGSYNPTLLMLRKIANALNADLCVSIR